MLSNCRKACERCEDVFVRTASERDDFVNVFFDLTVDNQENFLAGDYDDEEEEDEEEDEHHALHRRQPSNRVVFELFNDTHPRTSENFRRLVRNGNGDGDEDASIGAYKGQKFHRIINGFMNQAGATKSGSIYGLKFNDENINSRYHAQPYLLAMANGGPNTNGDQFYVTVNPQPHLDGKHVVFGRVIRGERVVEYVNQKCGSESGRPTCDVKIVRCGEMSS